MAGEIILVLIIALAGLVCLGRALWYAALLLFGHAGWDSAGRSMFTYQFGAVICAAFVVGYWNYLAETRAKSLLLSLLGLLFPVSLHIAFAVPLAQCLEARMPLLWHGAETQGRVVRVYMRETEDISFLFHSKKIKQRWEPRMEYEFTAADGTSYRGETSCLSSDDWQQGQAVPVLYLPANPQVNRISLFFNMWGDTLLFAVGLLGALSLTWYIVSRRGLGRKRRSAQRRRPRRWN